MLQSVAYGLHPSALAARLPSQAQEDPFNHLQPSTACHCMLRSTAWRQQRLQSAADGLHLMALAARLLSQAQEDPFNHLLLAR